MASSPPQPRKLIVPIVPPPFPIQPLQHLGRLEIFVRLALSPLVHVPLQPHVVGKTPSAPTRLARAVHPITVIFQDPTPAVGDGLWLEVVDRTEVQHVEESEGEGAADGLVGWGEHGPEGWDDVVAKVTGSNLRLERVHW